MFEMCLDVKKEVKEEPLDDDEPDVEVSPQRVCDPLPFSIRDADAKNISKRYKTTCSSNNETLCVQTRKDCLDIVQPDIQSGDPSSCEMEDSLALALAGAYRCEACSLMFPSLVQLELHTRDLLAGQPACAKTTASRRQAVTAPRPAASPRPGGQDDTGGLKSQRGDDRHGIRLLRPLSELLDDDQDRTAPLHSAGEEDPRFDCVTCGATCRSLRSLRIHEWTHGDGNANLSRPFGCSTCGARFQRRDILKKHQRTHSGEKPHVCGQCGHASSRRDHLREHERTHSKERAFVCGTCGAGFNRRDALRNHQWTHTGQRPFVCSTCGKGFTRRTQLRRHEQCMHVEVDRFACWDCGAAFARDALLRRHMREEGHEPNPTHACNKGA